MADIGVVEDEAPVRLLLQQVEEHAAPVALLATGRERALRLLQRPRPDQALSDIMLPALNGLALYRALRGRPAAAIPIHPDERGADPGRGGRRRRVPGETVRPG